MYLSNENWAKLRKVPFIPTSGFTLLKLCLLGYKNFGIFEVLNSYIIYVTQLQIHSGLDNMIHQQKSTIMAFWTYSNTMVLFEVPWIIM